MSADCFLDTNILVYAALGRYSSPAKYERARLIIGETDFAISSQVAQEFYVNVTRKSDKPLSHDQALIWLEGLRDRPFMQLDLEDVMRAAKLMLRYRISYWDSLILTAGLKSGASILYTEDLSHGQVYESIRVENPFQSH
jgi:predicted nucleic acid-binding protein